MDRNKSPTSKPLLSSKSPSSRRAWIEICTERLYEDVYGKSPSSRRAWIEILGDSPMFSVELVALLAEGVDRNVFQTVITAIIGVALLAEGVDRNAFFVQHYFCVACRPPRGGRG